MSKRVLIVDDDRNLLAGLKNRLHGCYDVETAPDGAAALACVASDPSIAVVVSDLRMPGIDGISLLCKIRHDRPDIVRILLTGNADLTVATNAINAGGVFRLLLKPCHPGEMESALTHALDHHERERRNQSLALEDYLLKIGNRRALEYALTRIHSLSRRHSRTYSLAMIDVDHFKHYNDGLGHLAGDRALQAIVLTICKGCRASDEAFRYGGEEIVLLLPDTPDVGAAVACERLRASVERLAIPQADGGGGFLTVSIGGASFDGNENVEARDILQRADDALFESKRAGRNRVTFWEPREAEMRKCQA